jgi:8-oxo-dGTP diphosphatase
MTVYLVRHASAGERDESNPDDALRPLDRKGRAQAQAIAEFLVDSPVVWVATSPATRCVETVAPLCEDLGIEPEVRADLFEGHDIDTTWPLVEKGAALDGDAVLCSHGDVIPDLVRRAQQRGMRIVGPSGWSKGSVWVLDGWDGQRFSTGTFVRPGR